MITTNPNIWKLRTARSLQSRSEDQDNGETKVRRIHLVRARGVRERASFRDRRHDAMRRREDGGRRGLYPWQAQEEEWQARTNMTDYNRVDCKGHRPISMNNHDGGVE